jgi:hypothetical protein
MSETRPQRIQLSRKSGWKMPENTVKVDRTTNWGNPYKDAPAALLVGLFRDLMRNPDTRWKRENLHKLRGKNLACWCALDQPCHADVLLELANAPTPPHGEEG